MVGGVGDRQVALDTQPVGEEVVEHPAVLAAENAVLRPAHADAHADASARADPAVERNLGDVVGEQPLQQRQRLGPRRFDLAHVRDVEDPAGFSHGHVLLQDAPILDRHLPAGELDEPGPGGPVTLEQGGAAQRRRALCGHRPRLAKHRRTLG